ncbi:MAG TPA: HNH endonuclease [Azospira sp.]|nr:HNH endonuclease [Azospira sp.]
MNDPVLPPPLLRQPRLLAELAAVPLILALDQNGVPQRWISWQEACFYYAREMVAWDAGENAFTLRGGISRLTGQRSAITTNSIIALRGHSHGHAFNRHVPPLSNRELFHRDRHLCAYCGREFPGPRLTRDHVVPISRGGRDAWTNVVTACLPCNQKKGSRLLERSGMELLYLPYIPNRAEFLILSNRQILADQMDFLTRHVPAKSRVI